MKQNLIKTESLSSKNLPNFSVGKGRNESCQLFGSIWMAWTKVNEIQQIFDKIFMSVKQNSAKIFWSFRYLTNNYESL